jgi:hypothetical protein
MAHQNAEDIGRLILPEAWLGVGPVHISLLTWLDGAMKNPGRVSRSEVTEVLVSGANAIASVRVHISSSSDRTKPEVLMSFRDTWVRRGDGWAWKEAVSLSSHSQTPPTSAEAARPIVEELRVRASKLCQAYPPAVNQNGESHFPVLRILVAHDACTGLAMRPQ